MIRELETRVSRESTIQTLSYHTDARSPLVFTSQGDYLANAVSTRRRACWNRARTGALHHQKLGQGPEDELELADVGIQASHKSVLGRKHQVHRNKPAPQSRKSLTRSRRSSQDLSDRCRLGGSTASSPETMGRVFVCCRDCFFGAVLPLHTPATSTICSQTATVDRPHLKPP